LSFECGEIHIGSSLSSTQVESLLQAKNILPLSI
jgi:hypothetical protein